MSCVYNKLHNVLFGSVVCTLYSIYCERVPSHGQMLFLSFFSSVKKESLCFFLVVQDESIPSKYNGLRLNKATTVPNTVIKEWVKGISVIYCGEDKGCYCLQHYLLLCFTTSSFGMRQKYSPAFTRWKPRYGYTVGIPPLNLS